MKRKPLPLFAQLYNQLNQQMVEAIGLLTHEVLTVTEAAAKAIAGKIELDPNRGYLSINVNTTRDLSENELADALAKVLAASGMAAVKVETNAHVGIDHRWRHAVAYINNHRVRIDVCSKTQLTKQQEAA